MLKRNETGVEIGFENPDESGYYESLGRINLYDLTGAISEETDGYDRYFNTLPMAIIETGDENFRISRCNKAYRDFFIKTFGGFETGVPIDYSIVAGKPGEVFANAAKQCARTRETLFVDEGIGNNSTIHAMIRHIATNPVTGIVACNAVVLGITSDEGKGITYADIANSLSSDYIDLYYVNITTEAYIQYHPDPTNKGLSAERHGKNYFQTGRRNAYKQMVKEDAERFIAAFVKEDVVRAIDDHGAFTITYRLLVNGEPKYVNMKAVRMKNDDNYLIIGVNNVDAQMKQQEALERMQEERITYSRISALAGNYICIYTVDPETDTYVEYGATEEYKKLGLDSIGREFFAMAIREITRYIYPEDLELFNREFTRANVMNDVFGEGGIFEIKFRLMINEKPTLVRLKAAKVKEKDSVQLIVGISNIDGRTRAS